MKRRVPSRIAALCVVALSGLCVTVGLVRAEEAAAKDTKAVQLPGAEKAAESAADKVYITSQPTKETIDALAEKGVKVVINLRRPDEMAKLSFDEATTVKSHGMTYMTVPMNTALPKEAELKTVLDALGNSKTSPVLLHCSTGNRAGAIWALYSGAGKGQPVDEAIAEGKAAGLTNVGLEHIVRTRITASQKAQ